MLAELGTRASSTSKNHAEFTRLEEVWAVSMGGDVILPRYSVESMLEFITWLAKDSGRARSFETILRAAGGVIAKTTASGLMSDPRVKALRARMADLIGELAQPCTHTPRASSLDSFSTRRSRRAAPAPRRRQSTRSIASCSSSR